MVFHEFTYISANGKTPIHAVRWLPDGEVIGVVQIAHGVAEHILRYEPFAKFLTGKGFAVVGNDHLGHGKSRIEGKEPLYFGPKGSWDAVVQDIEMLRQSTRALFPGVPYFLLGHSMGSFLARTYLIRHHGTVDGAIIMGTGQMGSALIKGGLTVAKIESRRLGEDKPSPLIDKIAHPFCGGIPSSGLFREMLGGIALITQQRNVEKMDKATPILFISGAMDPVGDLGKGVKRACASFRAAKMQDVQLKLYPGLRHEILNEDCRQEVYEDILRWLTAKLPK